jgi:hypothetical protein
VSGAALLDGVILAGWRTGARVHVEFQTKTNCGAIFTDILDFNARVLAIQFGNE